MALKHSSLSSRKRERASARLALPTPVHRNTKDAVMSVPTSPTGSDDEDDTLASLRVGVHLHRAEIGFADRVNTLHSYLEMNRHFLGHTSYTLPSDPKDRSLIDQKAQISSDCMIGDSTQVDERTIIKKSIIGSHCIIGKMTRIVGCILLDHCVIEEGSKLDGCILGKNTKVGAKAELVRCVTQAGYEVAAGETVKNEKLDVSDWAAGDTESSEGEGDDGAPEGSGDNSDDDSD